MVRYARSFTLRTVGAFHSTKIPGTNFWNFRLSNGTRPTEWKIRRMENSSNEKSNGKRPITIELQLDVLALNIFFYVACKLLKQRSVFFFSAHPVKTFFKTVKHPHTCLIFFKNSGPF